MLPSRLGVYHGIEEFATAQLPVYRDLTPDGLEKLTTKAFQIVDTDALDFLANYTTTLAGDVNRETTDGIMRTIRGAIATGKGVDDIVRDLGEVVKDQDSFRHAGSKVFSKAQYRMEVIARTEGLSLNMTKADVIALLDQLEPGVDHSGLAGQALIAAKKQFHIGPLKNKSQLIQALQQVAGKEMAQQAVQDAQHAAVSAATTALSCPNTNGRRKTNSSR